MENMSKEEIYFDCLCDFGVYLEQMQGVLIELQSVYFEQARPDDYAVQLLLSGYHSISAMLWFLSELVERSALQVDLLLDYNTDRVKRYKEKNSQMSVILEQSNENL